MTIKWLITLENGYTYTLGLLLAQPSYYALEYAHKLAKEQDTAVQSVEVVK